MQLWGLHLNLLKLCHAQSSKPLRNKPNTCAILQRWHGTGSGTTRTNVAVGWPHRRRTFLVLRKRPSTNTWYFLCLGYKSYKLHKLHLRKRKQQEHRDTYICNQKIKHCRMQGCQCSAKIWSPLRWYAKSTAKYLPTFWITDCLTLVTSLYGVTSQNTWIFSLVITIGLNTRMSRCTRW